MRKLTEVKMRELTKEKMRELIWVAVNQTSRETTNQNFNHFRTLNGHDKCMSAHQLVGPSSATAQRSEIGMFRY